MTVFKVLLITFLSILLSACAVVPNFSEKFDNKCQSVQKKIGLSVERLGNFSDIQCSSNDDCVAQLTGEALGSIIVFPVSAIISGSIAIVGNTIYWFKEQGECKT